MDYVYCLLALIIGVLIPCIPNIESKFDPRIVSILCWSAALLYAKGGE